MPDAPVIYWSTCITDCCQFKAAECINYINGDLIIRESSGCENHHDGDEDHRGFDPLRKLAKKACKCEVHDIFPNLVGINGSLYIVGTNYTKITGFDKLRYVTGSIVIVNNPKLIHIPAFPALLTVSSYPVRPADFKSCDSQTVDYLPAPQTFSSQTFNPELTPNAVCNTSAIIIASNPVLRKIVAFQSLRQVRHGIFVMMNTCLTYILEFIHLYRTERIVIQCNPRLCKILGFCYIDTINIALIIANNNVSGDFDLTIDAFLWSLETVGKLAIIGNVFLKQLNFQNLHLVQNDLIVRGNPQLENLVPEFFSPITSSLKTTLSCNNSISLLFRKLTSI